MKNNLKVNEEFHYTNTYVSTNKYALSKKNSKNITLVQATIAKPCTFEGVGVHSGLPARMTIRPAAAYTGFVFKRCDINDTNNIIPAVYNAVTGTRMSTTVSNAEGVSVSTIEHIMAALMGAHITNAEIEIDGPEVPIMDGSAGVFAKALQTASLTKQNFRQKNIVIDRPIRVENEFGFAEFIPNDTRQFDVQYDFAGRLAATPYEKHYRYNLDTSDFTTLLANARTFGLYEDAIRLQSMGLAKGASLDNTIILKDMLVLNEDGLRSNDEFVRHKILDAIGDIALAGVAIIGTYRAHNPGHDLNNKLLHAVFQEQARKNTAIDGQAGSF